MRKWEVNLEQPCLMMYCTTAWVEAETQEQAEFKAIHDPEVRRELDWSEEGQIDAEGISVSSVRELKEFPWD